MFYTNNVQDTRQLFYSSWEHYNQKKPLSPLEQQLIDVILLHPEYYAIFEKAPSGQAPEDPYYSGYHNPFLHMGLHLAIRDQIALDKPSGIRTVFQHILQQHKDAHTAEHVLMEQLYHCLSEAQKNNHIPDEMSYLKACRHLLVGSNMDD